MKLKDKSRGSLRLPGAAFIHSPGQATVGLKTRLNYPDLIFLIVPPAFSTASSLPEASTGPAGSRNLPRISYRDLNFRNPIIFSLQFKQV